jgi:alginate O-acetyltransferase complex protein AlgI
MLFTSYTYAYFFLFLVVPLRWLTPKKYVSAALFVASALFYLSWSAKHTLLLLGLTVVTYVMASRIHAAKSRRAALAGATVTVLLLVLGFFKYSALFLSTIGLHWRLELVLPLGVSFYTFEMISYVVDVYRGTPPATNLVQFLVYITYFPHLIAGPIVRANELLPQLSHPKDFDAEEASEGVFIALVGFIKKAVFADTLGVFADAAFNDPSALSTYTAWLAVLAYSGQFFCDFSGYTDIARGCSQVLGLRLPENFDYPYASRSITEFWQRWHMTLSRWLRDYLYIGLGGNRAGRLRTYRNLLLTMLLGGLWHGAKWTFVVWGAYHGILLAFHKLYLEVTSRSASFARIRERRAYKALAIAVTFTLVALGWVLFRAPTFDAASRMLTSMFQLRPRSDTLLPNQIVSERLLWLLAFVHLFGVHRLGLKTHQTMPHAVRGLVWAGMIAVLYLFSTASPVFIYFQF